MTSTIGVKKIQYPNGTDILTLDSSGTLAIGGNITSNVTLTGDLTIADKIIHSGDTDTEIRFSDANTVKVLTGGVENIKFDNSAVVVNNGGADVDFRVEGDADTELFFIDAGADQVCLGTSTTIANTKLNVAGGPIKASFSNGTPTTGNFNQFTDAGANTYNTMFHNWSSNPLSQYILDVSFKGATPDNGQAHFIDMRDATTSRCAIRADGDIRNHDNSYGAISDIKLKEQVSDATSQWDDIKALTIRKFKFKTDVATGDSDIHWRLGVIAQEVENAGMNGLVSTEADTAADSDGIISQTGTTTKSVKYSVLYMKAVKALQEAMARIETLEAKVTALESK